MSKSPSRRPVMPSGRLSALVLIGTSAANFFFAWAAVSLSAELSPDHLAEQYPAQVRPLLQEYCVRCHSTEEKKGDLDLARFETATDVRGATRVWQKVIRRLRDGEMPPEKKPQPSPSERRRLIDWSEKYLLADAREQAGDPGAVLMRRLTKAEYNYTIRDLTGVDLRPAQKFLEDSVAGEGFANTGEALFMAPDLIPKYLDAARLVSAHAGLTPSGIRFSASNEPHDRIAEAAQRIKDFYAQYTDGEGRLPLAEYIDVTLMYRDRVPSTKVALADLAAQQELAPGKKLSPKYLRILWNALNEPQPAGEMAEVVRQWRAEKRVAVKVHDAGDRIAPIPDLVAPGLIGAIFARQSELWNFNTQVNHLIGSVGLFGPYLIPLKDASGARKLDSEAHSSFARLFPPAVCFAPTIPVNSDVTVELSLREDEALSRLVLDDIEQDHLDRLWAEWRYVSREPVEVLYNTKQFIGFQPADRIENTEKFAALLPSLEAKAAAFNKAVKAAEPRQLDAVVELAARAWRRPLSNVEQNELRKLYGVLRQNQRLTHDAALRTLITRILVSPHFLYRIERPAAAEGDVALTDWELASRLSYFLWSSLPDDELRTAAAASQLRDKKQLAAQTRRMLRDCKSEALATEFAGQWLQFRGFDQYDGKSESRFPMFTPKLRAAMNREATEFVTEMIRSDRSACDLLRADYTYLNDQLAEHYNIPSVQGADFRRVDGVRQYGRGGIVAMGSVLTKQSGALRTSPVLRGAWIVETLLGREIPNPPDDVPQLDEEELSKEGLTVRQLLERHRADAACSTCHAKIDPYGFALEAYDPIGRIRDTEVNGQPIDARAEPQDSNAFEGLTGLQGYLFEHQDEFIRQFCRKLLGYSLGRTVELSDEPLLADMHTQLKNNNYRFSAAVLSIVESRQFHRHRGRNDPRETSQ